MKSNPIRLIDQKLFENFLNERLAFYSKGTEEEYEKLRAAAHPQNMLNMLFDKAEQETVAYCQKIGLEKSLELKLFFEETSLFGKNYVRDLGPRNERNYYYNDKILNDKELLSLYFVEETPEQKAFDKFMKNHIPKHTFAFLYLLFKENHLDGKLAFRFYPYGIGFTNKKTGIRKTYSCYADIMGKPTYGQVEPTLSLYNDIAEFLKNNSEPLPPKEKKK